MNPQNIGKFIALLRKEKNLTQEELGQKLGVTSKTISRWENGNYMPDLSLFEPLSAILGITITELLKGKRIEEKEQINESGKNILTILKKNKKEKKKNRNIILIILGILSLMILFSIHQMVQLKQIEEDYIQNVTFRNGIYTTKQNVEINETEYMILKTLQLNRSEIDSFSEIEIQNYLNYFYSELESYSWYGYVGGYAPTKEKSEEGISIMELVDKKLPLVAGPLETVSEKHCYLGHSKYGTFIFSKYENGKCIITEIECNRLSEKDATSNITISNYCEKKK